MNKTFFLKFSLPTIILGGTGQLRVCFGGGGENVCRYLGGDENGKLRCLKLKQSEREIIDEEIAIFKGVKGVPLGNNCDGMDYDKILL